MNLRPMEVRDNPAVAQLIRASLEEFGLDKPGTVYFDSHLDHLADFYQPTGITFATTVFSDIQFL